MDMTPQQFGSLVGDQMGKDAGVSAAKSLPVEALKLVGKAVYHTPRSLKTLVAGGAGGYALGHNAGEASGMEQGQAEAAKNLAERLLKKSEAGMKQAFSVGNIGRAAGFGLAHAGVFGGAGAGLGAAMAEPGKRLEGAQRGFVRGVGTSVGMNAGGALGSAAGLGANSIRGLIAGAAAGTALGGAAGYDVAGRAMGPAAQQPKPQMATGMPQAPAPQLNKAALLLGPQNDPLSKAMGFSGGVGGMMRNMNSASKTLANTSIDPASAQQLQAQQGPKVPSGPGGGLYMGDPNQALAKPMAAAGGSNPLSMSMAGKQAGLVPSFQQAAREGLAGMRGRFKILENMGDIRDRLLSGDHYPMPPLDKHLNVVNRGSIRAGDIGSQLQRMLKQMRVPADQIKDTVGNAPIAMKPNDSRIFASFKQAGAINELLSGFGGKAMQGIKNNARPMLNKAVEGVQTYGKRMMGDSTLKPLYQRADLVRDMADNFQFPTMRSGARQVGNENYHNLLTSSLNARKAILKERGAIDLTRNLTTGGAVAGTLGAIGMANRNNNKQANAPAPAASLAKSLAPYTSWGRGYNFGTDTTNQHHQNALAGGALMGGVAGLATEAMREKTDEEKKQSILRKFLRYAATSGAGAVGGAGAGGLVGALTAPGKLRMHDSLVAKLPADFTSGKLEAKGLMGLGPVGEERPAAAEKEAARGDMVNKLMSYLKNRTLLQAEVVQPAGKAITGGWQTTSGVLGAPGGIHHHFSPSTVREVTTPPVLVRDLMQKAKDLMPLSGGMPERGGGYFDNNQKDLAGVVKQLHQAKKIGVR